MQGSDPFRTKRSGNQRPEPPPKPVSARVGGILDERRLTLVFTPDTAGVAIGDLFGVISDGATVDVTDPDTGSRIGSVTPILCAVEVQSKTNRYAICRSVGGASQKPGSLFEAIFGSRKPDADVYLKVGQFAYAITKESAESGYLLKDFSGD
jgi:hypothetical protein